MEENIPTFEHQSSEPINSPEKKPGTSRVSDGWKLMIIGSVIGFASCLITLLDLAPNSRGLCLYGLTSLGVILAFVGCYLVMER